MPATGLCKLFYMFYFYHSRASWLNNDTKQKHFCENSHAQRLDENEFLKNKNKNKKSLNGKRNTLKDCQKAWRTIADVGVAQDLTSKCCISLRPL